METTQFIYVLRLIPKLLDEANWTDTERQIVGVHFNYLKDLLANGRLILAGRTLNLDEKGMGIVVFEAANETAARAIMENDPAVVQGIMTAELFPYRVALLRGMTGD